LTSLDLKNIIPILATNKEFINTFKNIKDYVYSLSSKLCLYLMNHKDIDSILYIDADIVFYYDFEKIYDEIKDKSIGIVPHWHNKKGERSGAYNVGIVYFKGDLDGRECLLFWNNCVTNPNNPYKKEYGTCWDQKYLELFEVKFPNSVCVIENTLVQGASWNFDLFNYNKFTKDDMRVTFKTIDKELLMAFIHFNRFVLDFKNQNYKFDQRKDCNKQYKYLYTADSYKILEIKQLCDEYYDLNKNICEKYKL